MPNKLEKERRKQLKNEIKGIQRSEFEKNMPMEREKFRDFFDYLDEKLPVIGCDHTNKMARKYLVKIGQNNIENILEWLAENGGYCDCEILANVEDLFLEHYGEAY
jgi:hypothetical protein